MMLTIHGLPPTFNYHELKMMIKHESSLNDFILDNLVGDVDGNKKVRIGVADESEGSHLIKCLDGFRLRGNVLKVIPVAKAPINTQQGNFNQRPGGYPLRNDLQNQPGNYTNPPSRPMGASPWTPNSNQWNSNQGATPQMQRNTFQGFQPQTYAIPQQQPPQQHQRIDGKPFGQHDMGNRMPPRDQGFGFQQKNIGQEANRRLEARQLRNVEVIPSAGRAKPPGRAPALSAPERYDDKPVTINKDYFQGSSQFGGPVAGGQQGPHFVPQNQSSQWSQSAPQAPKPGFKPAFEEDRKYPPPDKRSALLKEPEPRAMPNTYKEYEKSRYSPPRRASPGPPGPPGRRPSPGRRVGGRLSPSRRLVSPARADRRESPPRHIPRYSPPRRADKGDKFPPSLKHVRPAYEPEAPNQAMYSGGYRPSHHEGGQYPPGARPERGSPWQHERDKFQAKKDDDRPEPKHESPAHASRSPNRRERSPLRDRYRRNSPSPRSLPSPRRSWALEKRLSPELSDAPPPPTWPGPGQEQHLSRPGIGRPDKEDKPKHAPWDRRPFDAPEDVRRRPEPDNRPFKDELRVRRDLGQPPHTTMQPSPGARPYKEDRFSPKPTRASRFEPMTKFEQRDPKFEPRDPKFEPRDPKFDRRDPNFDQRDTKFDQRDPKFDLRDPKFDQRVSKFDQRDPKFEPRDPKFDLRDHKFEPREPKFEPRDPKFDPRPSRFDQREPKFEPRDPKFEPRDPKFDTRAPKFEPRDSNYEQRDPKFEPRVPKFEPRDPKFDSRDPKFEPRDPKYHQRDPKFEPRDPKFEPRDPKFEPRDPKFDRREPNFEPRDPKFDRHAEGPRSDRRDFRRMDELAERKDNFRSLREDDRDDYRRDDFRREKDDHKVFDKEFDDIYKRAMEFKQKVQELRRTGRSHDREEYDRRRMDERRPKFEDNRDYRDMDRRDERPRSRDEEFGRHREPEWQIEKLKPKLDSNAKAKREKAAEEISDKIIDKHATFSMSDEVRLRVYKELKFVVLGIMDDMFGNNDVSFIESVIKFNSAHTDRDGYKILQNVIGSLPEHLKSGKRRAEDASEIPAKVARHSPEDLKQDEPSTSNPVVPHWDTNTNTQQQLMSNMMMTQMFMGQTLNPLMVPPPYAPTFEMVPQDAQYHQMQPIIEEPSKEDGYNLYLCKTDFKPYSQPDAAFIKNYIITQLLEATENSQGWAPDITLKGLQGQFRYQVHTYDEASKDWLLNIDFKRLNVLAYTKEELWYERAAVWLPGHSRCRNIEPLEKLRLQNKKVEGADIGKWKLVRKIVNAKGTRVYIDMPPSSARALEQHKMLLSYELQKVNVYLKAVAVDKDVFDAGLKEISIDDQTEIVAAVQNSPMASLGNDPNMVKITLKGCKSMTLMQARKIKEIIIYNIYKYHQSEDATSRTDFIKYGFCSPDCFGIVPENEESRRWLTSLNIGRMNKHPIVVIGADDNNVRYIKMTVFVPSEYTLKAARVMERLRKSNHGVKGLNFTLWKPDQVVITKGRKACVKIDIDLESVETIIKLNFHLDYTDERSNPRTAEFVYEHSTNKLLEVIDKHKAEMKDSYDVANMDISQSDSDDDDDIICLGDA